jgi:mRNA interferase MazF
MRRGDIVTVAAEGAYGKPRLAVIVRSDVFPDDRGSVIVCQMTTALAEAPDFGRPGVRHGIGGLRRWRPSNK